MNRSTDNRWLGWFAVLTAAATFCLICVGGLVTSHGVGLSVPDWPTTYGYNMFFFPFSKWIGGIFYEHTHRLTASAVGLLTVVLSVWLWLKEDRRWLRWLGIAALFAVVLQGVLGGLRVTALKDELGIFHATLAQMFFVLVCAIALFTSQWWVSAGRISAFGKPRDLAEKLQIPSSKHQRNTKHPAAKGAPSVVEGLRFGASLVLGCWSLVLHSSRAQKVRCALSAPTRRLSVYDCGQLRYAYAVGVGMIFLQLILGATMRHQHAGLAIPDFPTAYGKLWPNMDARSVAHYNQLRSETTALNPITAGQIGLQMTHRIVALLIFLAVLGSAWLTQRRLGWSHALTRLSGVWLGLILAQIGLGAATIWTNKSADVATAHVAVGGLSLAAGALLLLMAHRCLQNAPGISTQMKPQGEHSVAEGAAPFSA